MYKKMIKGALTKIDVSQIVKEIISPSNGIILRTPTGKDREIMLSRNGKSVIIRIGKNKKYVLLEKIEKFLNENKKKLIQRKDFESCGIKNCEVLVVMALLEKIGIGKICSTKNNGYGCYFKL